MNPIGMSEARTVAVVLETNSESPTTGPNRCHGGSAPDGDSHTGGREACDPMSSLLHPRAKERVLDVLPVHRIDDSLGGDGTDEPSVAVDDRYLGSVFVDREEYGLLPVSAGMQPSTRWLHQPRDGVGVHRLEEISDVDTANEFLSLDDVDRIRAFPPLADELSEDGCWGIFRLARRNLRGRDTPDRAVYDS